MAIERKRRTYFFKASHPFGIAPKLDPVWVNKNHLHGLKTTLIFDTNVLIDMEKVVVSGNKTRAVKEMGLHNLISLLERCPPGSVCLSPAIAFNEMPPDLAEQCRLNYELFCGRHLPQFVDSPSAILARYGGKSHDYGFFDLDAGAQALLAIPFCSLIYLQLVDRKSSLTPIEKFEQYLYLLETEIDMLSAKEIAIARYCFANPPTPSKRLIDLRRNVFRQNFIKSKDDKLARNLDQLLRIAFNGACDLNLINCANGGDGILIGNFKQDCWVATSDRKLVEFAQLLYYVDMDGEAGKFYVMPGLDEHADDPYWKQSALMIMKKHLHRVRYIQARDLDVEKFPELARKAAKKAEEAFN